MKEKESWRYALPVEDLDKGKPVSIKLGKKRIMLVKKEDGHIHACSGSCTHYGAPLHKGRHKDGTITCPWHTARFDVTNGRVMSPPALGDLDSYSVKIEDGKVYLGESSKPEHAEPRLDKDKTFLIVGAGAAGNSAAETLRREGFGGKIVMVTAESDRPYDRPSLSKEYISGEAPDKWIPLHSPDFYDNWDIELLTEHKATELDTENQTVTFENGKNLEFDKLLCATGGVPKELNIPGNHLQGYSLLRSYEDARRILDNVENAESVAIIGAGFIGMEAAAALKEKGLETHVIAPESVPMASTFGEDIGNWLRTVHENHGVQFHLGNTVDEINGDSKVESLTLSNGTKINADAVIMGVGITPATQWLEGSGILQNGVVSVNTYLQSRVPKIYAAGDIALVPAPQTGDKYRVEHWTVAERQGQNAALNMLGKEESYREIPFFWTMQFEKSIKFAGFPAEYDRIEYRGSVQEEDFIAGYYKEKKLMAVSGLGRSKEILACIEALKEDQNISPGNLKDVSYDLL